MGECFSVDLPRSLRYFDTNFMYPSCASGVVFGWSSLALIPLLPLQQVSESGSGRLLLCPLDTGHKVLRCLPCCLTPT